MTSRLINSETYVYPPKSDQKPGDIPLGDCINDTTIPDDRSGPVAGSCSSTRRAGPQRGRVARSTRTTPACSRPGTSTACSGAPPTPRSGSAASSRPASPGSLSSPKINGAGKVEGQVKKQGYVALANNNLTYPGDRHGHQRQGRDRLHRRRRGLLPERGLRRRSTPTATSGRSTSRRRGSARTTGSPAIRPSSAIRHAPVGVTTARPSPTAARSGSHPSTSARPARYAQYYPAHRAGRFRELRRDANVAGQLVHADQQGEPLAPGPDAWPGPVQRPVEAGPSREGRAFRPSPVRQGRRATPDSDCRLARARAGAARPSSRESRP